jgi:hypothetical protein
MIECERANRQKESECVLYNNINLTHLGGPLMALSLLKGPTSYHHHNGKQISAQVLEKINTQTTAFYPDLPTLYVLLTYNIHPVQTSSPDNLKLLQYQFLNPKSHLNIIWIKQKV